MIGPHQGKELDLMLSGKKHLAAFSEEIIEGKTIPEDIIPEAAFKPYLPIPFVRKSKDIFFPRTKTFIRYVCFVEHQQTWRADAYFWIIERYKNHDPSFDVASETMIGRLLGYTEEDIKDYIKNFMS